MSTTTDNQAFPRAPGKAPVPELLRTAGGQPVTTAAAWETSRRPELLELFRTQVFGRNPVERPVSLRFETVDAGTDMPGMEGVALRKQVTVRYSGPGGAGAMQVVAFIPKTAAPAPAFLLICNRKWEPLDPARRARSAFWPAEELVARGYAAVAYYVDDVDPDEHDGFRNGVHGIFQPDPAVRTVVSWGTLAAWAWGASRVMDWIETEPSLDAARVAVVGHSRGGKTALWCAAADPRFAMAAANGSGCGGAKLNRMDLPNSESIAAINRGFPHWFCENFKRYGADETALPVDQHMLVALLAPRLAYISSATADPWAGPEGEFQSCVLASPAWRLYGRAGLVGETFPPADTPLGSGCVGYHLRTGTHDLTMYDWMRFADFADRHWRGAGAFPLS